MSFRSIIFFAVKDSKTAALADELSTIPGLKVFKTNAPEEVNQIVAMSSKAIAVFDNFITAMNTTFNPKKGKYKQLYIDWPKGLKAENLKALAEKNIKYLRDPSSDSFLAKIELYMVGRSNIFKSGKSFEEVNAPVFEAGIKAYMTVLEKSSADWKLLLSTHEKEDEIDSLLGFSWEDFVSTIPATSLDIDVVHERVLPSKSIHEFLRSSIFNGVSRIFVIHVTPVPTEEIANKIRGFLYNH